MTSKIYNRTAPVIAPEVTDEAKKAITSVAGMFPFMVGLAPKDRKRLSSMKVANKTFTEDAVGAAGAHGEVLPGYLSVAVFQNHIDGFEAMDEVVQAAKELYELLRDTRRMMGAAAYETARSLYHFLEQAAKDGVPGAEAAHLKLAARFKGQGKRKEDQNDKKKT